jgi:hypothetical protein
MLQELRDGFNRLRGRLFEAVEATGVDPRHQIAMKGLIRGLTYDMQGDIEGTLRRGVLEERNG